MVLSIVKGTKTVEKELIYTEVFPASFVGEKEIAKKTLMNSGEIAGYLKCFATV